MKKIVAISRSFAKYSPAPIQLLEQNGFEIICKPNHDVYNEERIAELIGDADGCIVGSDKIGAIVAERCPNLKIVAKHGVGLNNINLALMKQRGITVTSAPGANAHSTAELTWLLIMAANRNFLQEASLMKEKKGNYHATVLTNDLHEKVLGIVGFGHIGQLINQFSKGFEMRVLVYDPFVDPDTVDEGVSIVTLDELFEQADIITLNSPVTKDNFEMINRDMIQKMKDGVVIVNSARGELINEHDLLTALTSGKIKAAGLDVFQKEPPLENPLLQLENVTATPHVGGQSIESNIQLGMVCAEKIVSFFQ